MVERQMESDEQATSAPTTSPPAQAPRGACKAPSWQLPKGVIFPDYTLTLQSPHLINGGKEKFRSTFTTRQLIILLMDNTKARAAY